MFAQPGKDGGKKRMDEDSDDDDVPVPAKKQKAPKAAPEAPPMDLLDMGSSNPAPSGFSDLLGGNTAPA